MDNLAYAFRNILASEFVYIIIPFILIFTIVFAVLQKTKILGKDYEKKPKKNFNVMIALVLALAVIIPHVTMGTVDRTDARLSNGMYDVVEIIMNSVENIVLVIVAIVMILILIGAWGKNIDIEKSNLGGWIVIISFLVVIYIFATEAGWASLPRWLYFLRDTATQAAIVAILVFGIIIWFVTKEDKPKGKDEKGFMSMFKDVLKGDDD